jgi:hypothetical protein
MNLKTCLHSSTLDTMLALKERCCFSHTHLLDPAPLQCSLAAFLNQRNHKQGKNFKESAIVKAQETSSQMIQSHYAKLADMT